ncbi:MAG: sigma 54-interacting transcriptional regulator [Desulfatitalea sp.]|nr:sigma 54-interacting transcriptional regulator [Desulfatitalea sp.]
MKELFQDPHTVGLFLDQFPNGVLITDPDGYVIFINKPYSRFLGLEQEAQIGRHCTEVIATSRMHIVGKTGQPEINAAMLIQGENIVVQRIPIIKDGHMLAVFGLVMFHCIQDFHKLGDKLKLLESKVEIYEKELRTLRQTRYTVESIIGQSDIQAQLKKLVFRAAANNLTVLVTGESGCGKELYAQAIHNASARRSKPFVRINASAIPAELLESELFGYEKGAFTGAKSSGKRGKFHMAHQGTLFLDEIGDLPASIQPKLLRVLEEKEFDMVGGTTPVRSDFRLIAATNRNLEAMVEEKRFRSDLYYRLNVFNLQIPPLRERPDDILPQARFFLKDLAEEWSIATPALRPETEKVLMAYPWPGNSRELRHILQRTMATLDNDTIRPSDLPLHLLTRVCPSHPMAVSPLKKTVQDAEIRAIQAALKACENNKARAAKMLCIHRTLLYRRMKQLGMEI